ncbi:hypothetical protein QBC46DRAFT_430757, partial [Diplogelasinospora grovesii]
FRRYLGQQPWKLRLLWVFITHQNHAGDPGAGYFLSGVRAVYRLFSSLGRFQRRRTALQNHPPPLPVEEWDWGTEDNDPYSPARGARLCVYIRKNKAGRDAATDARMAGHEESGRWFG